MRGVDIDRPGVDTSGRLVISYEEKLYSKEFE
jgi:hypothetical protein